MIGKLVRITDANIGVSKGTLGLVMKVERVETTDTRASDAGVVTHEPLSFLVYEVLLCQPEDRERRFLEQHLEVVEV